MAHIPTLRAFDAPQEAFDYCREADAPQLVLVPDDESRGMTVWKVFPSGHSERRPDFKPLPNGNWQSTHGTQYIVAKWCHECRDWKGVGANLQFLHETHMRRTA